MKKYLSKIIILVLAVCMVAGTGITSVFAAPSVTRISIKSMPKVTVYEVGEAFNIDGLKVVASLSDKSQTTVDNKNLKFKSGSVFEPGYKFQQHGEKKVEVTYGNVTTYYYITVLKAGEKGNIVFDPNGGTGKKVVLGVNVNAHNYLPKQSFKKSGYSLIGWSTSKKAKASAVLPIDSLAESLKLKAGKTVTIYAQWAKTKKYTISYNLGKYGKFVDKAPKSYTTGNTTTLPYLDSKNDKYIFNGWYKSTAKNAKPIYELSSNASGNIKLYARFIEYKFEG